MNSDVATLQGHLELCDRCPVIEERVKHLEGRIVGNTADGWHRRDHDLYAEAVEQRFLRLEAAVKNKP